MLQSIDNDHWIVKSTSGLVTDGYTVSRKCANCTECTNGQSCSYPECGFLCRHMYMCDDRCYDYGNGHICKHIHRVHSLQQLEHQEIGEVDPECHPVPVYYPPTEQPTADDTGNQGMHKIYNIISITN